MDNKKRPRRTLKTNTNKIIDRIVYNPVKHKQKYVKKLRNTLHQRKTPSTPARLAPSTQILVGAINLNDLDLETGWAVGQLLTKYNLDVCKSHINNFNSKNIILGTSP